jgi:hypothetical protein
MDAELRREASCHWMLGKENWEGKTTFFGHLSAAANKIKHRTGF